MSDINLNSDNNLEATPVKKKCCGKIKTFFTKEAVAGQRVYNWKFGVAVAVVVVLVWVVL